MLYLCQLSYASKMHTTECSVNNLSKLAFSEWPCKWRIPLQSSCLPSQTSNLIYSQTNVSEQYPVKELVHYRGYLPVGLRIRSIDLRNSASTNAAGGQLMPTLMSLLSTSNIMTSRWQPATKRRDIVELLTVTAHGRFGLHLFWRKKTIQK